MFTYTVEQWLVLFYVYCFLGWCFESAYVSLRTHHPVNRGFMRGPFLPLYGSGAIMMYVVSKPFADNVLLTYLAGCIGATALEYVTGAVMEMLFKIRYWDYSNQRFHYKGYICLSSSLAWGLLTILMTRVIHGPIEAAVLAIPEQLLAIIVFVLTIGISCDFALSFKAALDLRDVLIKLEEAREDMHELEDRLKVLMEHANDQVQAAIEKQGDRVESVKAEIESLRDNIQEELTNSVEVGISRLNDFMEEHNIEELNEIKAEYREWRQRVLENSRNRREALQIRDKFRMHHMTANPSMKSERFKEAIEEIRKEIREMRNDPKAG